MSGVMWRTTHLSHPLYMSVGWCGYEKWLTLAYNICKFRILHTLLSQQYLVLLCVSTDLFICHHLALPPNISLNECDVNSTQCVHLNRALRNSVSPINISVISPTSHVWRGWGQVSDRHRPWRRQRVFCLSQVFWCRNDIACRTHTSVNGAGLVISAVSPSSFLLCNATPPMQCSKQIQHCRPEEKWNTAQKEMTGRERWGEV